MTLSLGFVPNAQPHDNVTYAQETAVTQDWTLAQYPDYYVIEGKSAIQKEDFPQLKTTTEKVYKKVVVAQNVSLFRTFNMLI